MDKTPKTKVCSKCGKRRERSKFYKRQASVDGLAYVCKLCDDARTKAVPIERRRAKHKAWRDANRDHVREKGREAMRRLYANDPQKFRDRSKDYAKRNPEKIKERNAARDPEDLRRRAKSYRTRNPEKVRDRMKRYRSMDSVKEKAKEIKAKDREALSDTYVKRVLFPGGIPESVPKSLIEAKRLQIQLTRYLKNGN